VTARKQRLMKWSPDLDAWLVEEAGRRGSDVTSTVVAILEAARDGVSIYIVQGATGDRSDPVEWLVYAFWTEAEAQSYCDLLTAERQKLGPPGGQVRFIAEGVMRSFDPNYSEDYTGTSWWVSRIELRSLTGLRAKGGVK
jgi:hypothetical protein